MVSQHETRVYCRLCFVADMRLHSYSEWMPQQQYHCRQIGCKKMVPVSGRGCACPEVIKLFRAPVGTFTKAMITCIPRVDAGGEAIFDVSKHAC